MANDTPFECTSCSHNPKFGTLGESVLHQKNHIHDLNFSFTCHWPTCGLHFGTHNALDLHVRYVHGQDRHIPQQERVLLLCSVPGCALVFPSSKLLCQHLKKHHLLQERLEIQCPFKDKCKSDNFFNHNPFKVHLSQKHKGWNSCYGFPAPAPQETAPPDADSDADSDDHGNEENVPFNENFGGADATPDQSNTVHEEDISVQVPDKISELYNSFHHSLAMFYLKLESVHLIPADTVQKISEGIQQLSETALSISKEVIKKELSSLNLEEDVSERILFRILSADAIYSAHHKDVFGPNFSTKALRKTYYKTHYKYVKPIEINLSKDTRERKCVYYVPIQKSLELSLQTPEIKKEVAASFTRQSENGILKDYTDGSLYKKKKQRSNNEKTVDIIFFQDGFLPVKSLSSVSNDYQMLGMYMAIGNLRPHLRSKIKCMHLVALVPNFKMMFTEFKLKCFKRVFDDLKKLEENGVLFMGEQVKVELRFVIGDNKGQHEIGGFIKSFSHEFFCRYCPMTKTQIHLEPWKIGPLRTREEYELYSTMVPNNRETYMGVGKPEWLCPFNALSDFHVCDPGLCPCVGHDLYEGVIDYDFAFIICHFVEEKWFTYEELKRSIKKFKYVGQDSGNKPAPVKEREKKKDGTLKDPKLGGNAVQNWTLLRLLPFIIEDKILDPNDEFWLLYLTLKEITDLVSAPSISLAQLSYLKLTLEEYALRRQELLGDGKPKHHYVTHFADLTAIMGPLIHVMTLRFEHFHQFFIRLAERSHNFINIGISSVKKYCMYMAYIIAGSPFVSGIQILEPGVTVTVKMATEELPFQHAIASRNIDNEASVFSKVVVDEVEYREGQWLLLGNHSFREIVVAKINSIVLDGTVVYLVVQEHVARYLPDFGIYTVDTQSLGLSCIPESEVHYPICHSMYEWGEYKLCFSLKFTLSHDAVNYGRF